MCWIGEGEAESKQRRVNDFGGQGPFKDSGVCDAGIMVQLYLNLSKTSRFYKSII